MSRRRVYCWYPSVSVVVLVHNQCFESVCSAVLDPVAVSQFPLHFILTHTRLSLAVHVWLTSQVHNGVKQQSHC